MSTTLKAIYAASLFREPSDAEIELLELQFSRGLSTPTLLASQLLIGSEAEDYQRVGALYLLIFNRAPTYEEMLIWGGILRSGIPVNDLTAYFLNSELFSERVGAISSVPALLQEMVGAVSSFQLGASEAQAYATQISSGTLSPTEAIAQLLAIAETKNVGVKLLTSSVNGAANLALDTPTEETLELAVSTLLNDLSTATLADTVEGSDVADVVQSTDYATTLRGLGGDDIIQLSSVSETILFESSASANGVDLIRSFTLGEAGDVLDFRPYLNQTNATPATSAVSSTATAESPWRNGDILAVAGNGLSSASNIAGLFGTGSAFASPTEGSKAVVITADIVGNASIWYLLNQTDTSNVTADELTLVGTLEGINNIKLVGFTAANFATNISAESA